MVVDLWMLDKKEQEKVTLLTELANSDEMILPVSELMDRLDWSKYKVLENARALNGDIQVVMATTDDTLLISDDSKTIYLDDRYLGNVDGIISYYIKNSVYWQFTLDVLNETMKSYEHFALQHAISAGTVSNIKQTLNERLAKYNLTITPNYHFEGNEMYLHSMLFHIMMRWDVVTQTDKIRDIVAREPIFKDLRINASALTNSRSLVIQQFLAISLVRARLGHFINSAPVRETLVNFDELDDRAQWLITEWQAMLERQGISMTNAKEESVQLLYILYLNNIRIDTDWMTNVTKRVKKRLNDFIFKLENLYFDCFNTELEEEELANLRHHLFATIIRSFGDSDDLFIPERFSSIDVATLYPVVHEFTNAAMKIFRQDMGITNLSDNFLYDKLVVTFLNDLAFDKMFKPIVVNVNMQQYPSANRVLQEMIKSVSRYEIVFTENTTKNADLVISNFQANVEPRNKFEWTALPTSRQWHQFEQRLGEISISKLNKTSIL